MIQVNIADAPAALRAAVLAMKRADRDIRKVISTDMRGVMGPVWKQHVTQHLTGSGRMESRMLTPGVRIAAGNPPALVAASSTRKVGNGLVPNTNWPGWEYGQSRDSVSEVTNRYGTTYERHTNRHLPSYRKGGRVLGPAAKAVLPRIAAYWVQSVVRAFLDAAEGKR